jgi:hypothetical protein
MGKHLLSLCKKESAYRKNMLSCIACTLLVIGNEKTIFRQTLSQYSGCFT